MSLNGKRILLTGAAGGIGQPLALALSSKGAKLALVDRDRDRISTLCEKINQMGLLSGTERVAIPIITDFQETERGLYSAESVVSQAVEHLGGVDILINSAGILDFTMFEAQNMTRISQMMHINATVPILLTHALLPHFFSQNSGQIVNIGSIFGSIGFPHYATYSASKFAVHGFSQALRRELSGSNVFITYIAPRAVKTPMNDQAALMLAATKTAMDDPQMVVAKIIQAIESKRHECYIGQPESFFAWLNGFLPGLVDIGLKKQTQIASQFLLRKNYFTK